MEYVYKYENGSGEVVYVGITNDMHRRISEHKKDKLSAIRNPDIFYFPVLTRADAEMLETYLIGHYRTGQHYNVSKTRKGEFTFIDICDQLPWKAWSDAQCDDEKPFLMSSLTGSENIREIIVEKRVYVDAEKSVSSSVDKLQNDIMESRKAVKERIEYEEFIIGCLQDERNAYPYNNVVREGLRLHINIRKCLRIWETLSRKDPMYYKTLRDKKQLLLEIWRAHENKLRRYENRLAIRSGHSEDVLPLI